MSLVDKLNPTHLMTINHHRFDGDSISNPLTLGVWLRALESHLEHTLNSPSEMNEGFVLKRDYTDEARIIHETLLWCSQLLINLIQVESGKTFDASAPPTDASGAAAQSGETAWQRHVASRESMNALWEILLDATNLVETMLKTSPVSLQGWSSFKNVLMREVRSSDAAERIKSVVNVENAALLPTDLISLNEKIAPEALGADMHVIFLCLTRQLEYLSFIEKSLKGGQSLKPLLPIFTLVNSETSELLEHIEQRALKYVATEKHILEALDGTAYALRMELRKAFEYELAGVKAERQPHYVYAKIENAHGLLRNCYQQSIVSLAQLFEPELQGTQLFGFFQTKLDESLSLRGALWKLLRTVRQTAQDHAETKLANLSELLGAFREHNMRFLMYKDWESFERFNEEIEQANGKPQIVHVLHRFEAYLETLFSQVNMRAVLSNHPFDANQTA